MRKSCVVTCLSVLICLNCFSQKLPRTLLWRISGNGLSRPSYLFGTMHVYDPRLFNLGDSLLQAISSSEGFANELDLNQITPMLMEMVKKEFANKVSVKEIMTSKSFERYGPALSKKFNKPAEDITTMDILKEKNKWIDDGFKGKKMQTFLDAYLADLAYRQGKWMGGVEDFSDQSGIMNSLIDESDIKQLVISSGSGQKSELEEMTNLYLNNDLDGFQHLMNGMDSNYRDALLVKRNKKMAFRMDSLARIRSTVFAIGAAHLLSDEGLISLLKAKGYDVTPVFSSKKIDPKDYSFPEVIKPWVEVTDPEGHYKVMMPGTPGNLMMYGILNMEMYFNIFSGTWFMTSCIPLPYAQGGVDSVGKEMLKEMFGKSGYREEKLLDINGIPGKSYVQKDNSGYKKVYLLYKDNLMYYAVAYSMSDAEASIQAAGKFFDSFQIIAEKEHVTAAAYPYTDSTDFFKISLPAKPKTMDNLPKQEKSSLKSTLLITTDLKTGAYYFLGVNKCREGYTYQNDSSVLAAARENLLTKFSDITRDTFYTTKNRRVMELDGSMLNGSMRAKTKIILRGNRYYTLLIMYGPGKWNQTATEALSSFKLLEYPPAPWRSRTSSDSLFTTWSPAEIIFNKANDSSDGIQSPHYASFDSNRVHLYIVRMDTLSKYFWQKNDSAFWKYEKERFVTDADTVLSEKIFRRNGLMQYEFMYRSRESVNTVRMQMWVWGGLVYRIATVQEPETIKEENVNRLFDQLHLNRPAPEAHVFDSKISLLLSDLRSGDSATKADAIAALSDAPFSESEVPTLQNAVLISYPKDSNEYKSTNRRIAERLIKMKDSSSVIFAREQYPLSKNEEVRNALAGIISADLSAANYYLLGKMLLATPPRSSLEGWVTNKWDDSLPVAEHLFPTVFPLIKDSVMAADILDIGNTLLDSDRLSIAAFLPWQQAVLKHAGQRLKITLADTLSYSLADYSVISILQRFKTDSANAMLKKWLTVKGNVFHKQQIVLALLKNNQPVSAKALTELAEDRTTRVELYRNLQKFKKTPLFPVKYLTQSSFAESLADDAATSFTDETPDMSFIRFKEMKWKGKMQRFFFYDVYNEEDNEHWLAAAGPYHMNRVSVSLSEAKAEVYSEEQYDAARADVQMKALILQMEKE